MLKNTRFAALAILGALVAGTACAAENKPADTKPAATVNGVAISQELVDSRVKLAVSQGQQQDTEKLREAVREDLINLELMSQEALKKSLDKQPETAMQLGLEKQKVLASALVQDYVKNHPVSDEAVNQEYEKLKSGLGGKEYHVRHILVEKESEAKAIAAKLKKGGKFDALAKAHSQDAGSRENGGDLGWIAVGNIPKMFVKPFGDALMALGKGQVSGPVQSQFGWHIVKLEDERELKMPPVEELKPRITQILQQQAVKQLITDLRDKAKISE